MLTTCQAPAAVVTISMPLQSLRCTSSSCQSRLQQQSRLRDIRGPSSRLRQAKGSQSCRRLRMQQSGFALQMRLALRRRRLAGACCQVASFLSVPCRRRHCGFRKVPCIQLQPRPAQALLGAMPTWRRATTSTTR